MSDHSYSKSNITSRAPALAQTLVLSSPHSLSPFPPLLQSHLAHGPVLAKFWNSAEVSHYVYASEFHQSCWTSRRDNPHSLLGDSCSVLKCWFSACPPSKLSTAPHVFLTKWHLEIKERCQLLQSCQGRFSRYRRKLMTGGCGGHCRQSTRREKRDRVLLLAEEEEEQTQNNSPRNQAD